MRSDKRRQALAVRVLRPLNSPSGAPLRICYNRARFSMNKHRLQQLEETLERILTALKLHYHPEQVIVSGSLASGQITDTSDLGTC